MASKFKIVVGANFGDEGKGHITNYLCNKESSEGKKCIVVCSNGGAQRGHTVALSDDIRHVFKHFGSGTFQGASTYLSEDYILNPMIFRKEYEELHNLGYDPVVYCHPNCLWSTPFDMILNQLVEDHREKAGTGRHGSCGVGIWETISRSTNYFHIPINSFSTNTQLYAYLVDIRDNYFNQKVKEYDITEEELLVWKDIIYNDNLINNYIDDVVFMKDHVESRHDSVIMEFDTAIFENGQGLLLDQSIEGYGDNTTPSNTGINNPCEVITNLGLNEKVDIEVIYVSRSYMTRHGAGRFDSECSVKNLVSNKVIYDSTNVPNPYQGSLRYGKLDINEMIDRVKDDYYGQDILANKLSIAFTHLDEVNISKESIEYLLLKNKDISKCYLSKGSHITDIIEVLEG